MGTSQQMQTAYAAALQALAGASVRHLAAAEFDDPDVTSVSVRCERSGVLVVELFDARRSICGEYEL